MVLNKKIVDLKRVATLGHSAECFYNKSMIRGKINLLSQKGLQLKIDDGKQIFCKWENVENIIND